MRHRLLLVLASAASVRALDLPTASSTPSGARIEPEPPLVRRPNPLISGLQRVTAGPVKLFREAPPITRSWVTASIVMAWLSSQRLIDMRNICVDERAVWYRGEWWRLLTNFFFMGDSIISVFFWMQMYHFWECLKVLEIVKYRYEPEDFVKMILVNAVMLLGLKQYFKSMIFLGSPMVMVFVYIYSRTYEDQMMNLLGFFQIRCGWLPFTQMIQDGLQTGDIVPNLLGLVCGHLYYYCTEVAPNMILPASPIEAVRRLSQGLPMEEPPPKEEGDGDGDGDGDAAAAADAGGEPDDADDADEPVEEEDAAEEDSLDDMD